VGQLRGRSLPARRSPRRLNDWGLGPGGTVVTTLAASGAQLVGGGIISTVGGITIVRIRGLAEVCLISSTSPGDGFFGALGIGIASSAAFDAGIASLPTPITDAEYDGWLWFNFFSVHESSADEAGSGCSHYSAEIDTKAMRKIDGDIRIYAAVEVVEIGTAIANLHLDSRALFKMS